ncbi:MAG: hypothetical protein ACI9FB_002103 [Candidatus Azotimanducaceae bacterium]|jgi:hypothetical protein
MYQNEVNSQPERRESNSDRRNEVSDRRVSDRVVADQKPRRNNVDRRA